MFTSANSACFNSTLVRLKDDEGKRVLYYMRFQFHVGTIKRNKWPLMPLEICKVSIPRWYD